MKWIKVTDAHKEDTAITYLGRIEDQTGVGEFDSDGDFVSDTGNMSYEVEYVIPM